MAVSKDPAVRKANTTPEIVPPGSTFTVIIWVACAGSACTESPFAIWCFQCIALRVARLVSSANRIGNVVWRNQRSQQEMHECTYPSLFGWNSPQSSNLWYGDIHPRVVSLVLTLLILPVSLGICTGLFLQCMGALLNPVNRMRGGVRWGLAVHTIAMFSTATMKFAMEINLGFIDFTKNQEFFTNEGFIGEPTKYLSTFFSHKIDLPLALAFPLNQWLSDGLLVSPVPIFITTYRFIRPLLSCIVAWFFIPRATGSSGASYHFCISPLLVCPRILYKTTRVSTFNY